MNDLELIRDLYDDLPDQGVTDRDAAFALDALRNHIDPPPPARRRWRGLLRRRTRRVAVALAGASALVIAGAVLLDGSDSRLAPESAAAYLGQAARSAAQSDEPWRLEPGQYWYVEKKIVNTGVAQRCDTPAKGDLPDGGFMVRGDCGTITTQSWHATDYSGRYRQTGPTGSDGKVYRTPEQEEKGDPSPTTPYIDLANGDGISYRELVDMPADQFAERVRQAAQRWADEGHGTTESNLFLLVGRLLGDRSLSPDQRAALYRMTARQPGIRSLGQVTDPEGRPGVAVGRGEPGREEIIIFDPQTSNVLAVGTGLAGRTPPDQSQDTPPDLSKELREAFGRDVRKRPGARGQYTVFLKSGIVNSTTETP
jgi:hypothetical protein